MYGNPWQSALYNNTETSKDENCNVHIKLTKIRMIKALEKEIFLCKNVVSQKQPCSKCLLMSSHTIKFLKWPER